MKFRFAGFLAFVLFTCQHFQLFSLMGFPVTLGALAGIALWLLVARPASLTGVLVSVSAVIFFSGAAVLFSPSDADFAEYLRTLTLMVLAVTIIGIGWSGVHLEFIRSRAFHRAVLLALIAVVSLSVAQVVAGSLGSEVFFNPFGSFQYLYEYNPYVGGGRIPRAHGFFLEPSYDAFVICALSVVLFCIGKSHKTASVMVVVGLLACQSATGLLLLVGVLAIVAFRARPAIGGVSALLLVVMSWSAGPYMLTRLGTLDETSTSANYRIVAPLTVLADVLVYTPLGKPLGSVQTVMSSYALQNGNTQGSSLDNGFYVLVFYFGWLGILGLVVITGTLLAMSIKRSVVRTEISWIAPIWLLGSLMFSGGIVLPEFALMSWVVVVTFKHFKPLKGQTVNGKLAQAGPFNSDRYLQRPAGLGQDARIAP